MRGRSRARADWGGVAPFLGRVDGKEKETAAVTHALLTQRSRRSTAVFVRRNSCCVPVPVVNYEHGGHMARLGQATAKHPTQIPTFEESLLQDIITNVVVARPG